MSDRIDQLIAGPLLWLSTLHAAGEVVRSRAERSRGIDPSALESPSEARDHMRPALRDLEELVFKLQALEANVLDDVDGISVVVARLDALLIMNRAARLLDDLHRRLLSLYPDVDEQLIEETRAAATVIREAVSEDEVIDLDALVALCGALRTTSL